jgi:hypothetical protein
VLYRLPGDHGPPTTVAVKGRSLVMNPISRLRDHLL